MGIITISTQQGTHSPLVAFLSLKNKSLEFLKDLCSAFLLKTILIFLDIQVSSLIPLILFPPLSHYFHVLRPCNFIYQNEGRSTEIYSSLGTALLNY